MRFSKKQKVKSVKQLRHWSSMILIDPLMLQHLKGGVGGVNDDRTERPFP